MPTINLNKKRVLELVGKQIPDSELKDRISYLGTDLEEVTKDEIIVEIFPNRPDLLSEEGFARALSSFIEHKKGLRKYSAKKSNYKIIVSKEVKEIRPYTACAVIKNLKLDNNKIEDIIKIQEKLHVTYGRNRKRCAIGIYPLESINFPITYTALPPKQIKFVPLDSNKEMTGLEIIKNHQKGKEYAHLLDEKKKFPVFIDSKNQILSVPPLINSEKTGKIISETKDVFLECSGHDFKIVSKAVNMISCAFADMGGEIYETSIFYEFEDKIITPELKPETIKISKEYIQKYVGKKISDKDIKISLEKMGFDVNLNKDTFAVDVPAYRTDVLHPIDLVEDISIGYGYEKIEPDNNRVYSTGKEIYSEKIKRKIRELFVSVGLLETNNLSLINEKEQKEIFNNKKNEIVSVKNSISSEFNSLRRKLSLLHLKTLNSNKIYEYPQFMFEIGTVFKQNNKKETGVEEISSLVVCLSGEKVDFTSVKQLLDLLFASFDIKYSLESAENTFFINGRTGKIIFNKQEVGEIGEVSPFVLEKFDLLMPISLFEIELTLLFDEIKKINS